MNLSQNLISQIPVSPLGAGDLVDRAVRFYRTNFWTFVLIAAPPVVVGTMILVGWTTLGREIFSVGSYQDQFEKTLYYLFVWWKESLRRVPAKNLTKRMFDDDCFVKQHKLMKAIDEINQKFGKDTVRFGSVNTDGTWKMKQTRKSQSYTTDWNEILTVN